MTANRSGIFVGDVVHVRLRPVYHKLRYSVFSLLVDLEELERLDAQLRFFSRNRFNLVSLYDRDHGTADGHSIRESIHELLEQSGFALQRWSISMLCYPRVFGYVFNPITVYFCRDTCGDLQVIVYEVNNTFGERRHYVVPVMRSDGGVCFHGCKKSMTVSPFNRCEGDYGFQVREPGDDVMVSVLYRDTSGPLLRALFAGERQPLSDRRSNPYTSE